MKRLSLFSIAALAAFVLAFALAPSVRAQDVAPESISQDPGPQQQINILYPNTGIVLKGTGDDAVTYKGLIYVQIYATSSRLIKKYGSGPAFQNEIYPSQYVGAGGVSTPRLPYGIYEVHFSIREGDTLRTCIKKNILLDANSQVTVTAEISGTASTLVIGDDLSFRQLEVAVVNMAKRLTALQAEVDALKGKPTPAAPDAPAK